MNDVPDFYAGWAANGGDYSDSRSYDKPCRLECQCCGRTVDCRHEDTYRCDDEYDCVCAQCCLEYHKNAELSAKKKVAS